MGNRSDHGRQNPPDLEHSERNRRKRRKRRGHIVRKRAEPHRLGKNRELGTFGSTELLPYAGITASWTTDSNDLCGPEVSRGRFLSHSSTQLDTAPRLFLVRIA